VVVVDVVVVGHMSGIASAIQHFVVHVKLTQPGLLSSTSIWNPALYSFPR
jgi:hypothetical protein